MSIRSLALGVVLLSMACVEESTFSDEDCGDPVELRLVSYNLAQAQGARLETLATHVATMDADFISVQECANCDDFLDLLPEKFELADAPRSGVTVIYDCLQWEATDTEFITLGDNDDGWGQRVLHWARFRNLQTDHCINVYSTHWCVTLRTPDDACDVERQLEYAQTSLAIIEERGSLAAPTLLAGDFNVFDGFEQSLVVDRLKASGLVDAWRQHDMDGDGTTFQGNSWAPAGRLDYIFASAPVAITGAYIDRSINDGDGSDHYPIVATMEFLVE